MNADFAVQLAKIIHDAQDEHGLKTRHDIGLIVAAALKEDFPTAEMVEAAQATWIHSHDATSYEDMAAIRQMLEAVRRVMFGEES